MNEKVWIWFCIGLFPYRIKGRYRKHNKWKINIVALFWRLYIKQHPKKGVRWNMRVPLIEKLRQAVWAAIVRLQSQNA